MQPKGLFLCQLLQIRHTCSGRESSIATEQLALPETVKVERFRAPHGGRRFENRTPVPVQLKEFSGSYIVGLTAVAAIMISAAVASMSLKLVVSKE